MPLYEFRYEDGHVEEHIVPVGTETYRNSSGAEGKRVWSTFALKVYKTDRSDWELIAPKDADGKPMTLVEAQRSGQLDSYSPTERLREQRHQKDQRERLDRNLREAAKRSAWREVSQKNRIRI